MKPNHLRTITHLLRVPSTARLVCAAALLAWPLLHNAFAAEPQKTSSAAPQTTTKKVANPLNEWLDEAQHDIDKSDFAAAIEPLQKVIKEEPNVAYPHFQLAYVFSALQRGDDARAEYERVIAIDPKMAAAYLNLGILLVDKDPAAAVAPLKKAVELSPTESHPRVLLGVAQERSKDLDGAAESFASARRLDPRDADTAERLGTLYMNMKRPADAEPQFRSVLETNPKNKTALLGLAKSLDEQNKPEATSAYDNYLAVEPSDEAVRSRRLHSLLTQDKYDDALAELDRSDAAHGVTSDSLRQRADILVAQKKWEAAIATIQKALALAPNDAQLHGGLGRLLMQRREFQPAEKELKTALALDRNNLAYLKDLSSTYYLGGNYAAALAIMDEIAKVEKPTAFTWFIRALCYDKLNQPKPALAAYQTFLTMTTDKNTDQVWQATERSKVLRRMLEDHR
ncbi:MAG TPA: tetratricopeptide repeat protein [Candidatus Dormibacteraeota bacterium]|nr:tetratricopeptide repeat protein [Candidatus Dormibacteraeota bacterium]